MSAQSKKNPPLHLQKQAAHEVLVELIDELHSKKRQTPTEKIWGEVAIYLLGRMLIPRDKLSPTITHLKKIAHRRLDHIRQLDKLIDELQRNYQDLVR